jgi:RNA 2',3'-cyclic 3'-phosphodiesterase
MPRLFIAVVLPDSAREKLAEICSGLPGADWTPYEQYHLTLRFLGEVESSEASALADGLEGLFAKSFRLSLRGLGVFPLRGDPEILWAGAARNEALASLRHKVESLVVRRGQPPEGRKFHPHVTLAKVRGSRPDWVGSFVAGHSLFAAEEIAVQTFALYSSNLTPEGAVHTLEREYPLDGLLEAE